MLPRRERLHAKRCFLLDDRITFVDDPRFVVFWFSHFSLAQRRACAAAALLPGAADCPVLAAVRTRPLLAQLSPHRQARTFRCNTLRSTRTQRHTIKETNSLWTILAASDPGPAALDRDVPLLLSGANVGDHRGLHLGAIANLSTAAVHRLVSAINHKQSDPYKPFVSVLCDQPGQTGLHQQKNRTDIQSQIAPELNRSPALHRSSFFSPLTLYGPSTGIAGLLARSKSRAHLLMEG